MDVAGAWMGGGGCADIGDVLHRGSSGSTPLQVRDVVYVPADWESAGRISPSGGTDNYGADTIEALGQDMDVPSSGGDDNRCGCEGGRDIFRPPLEHLCAVYHNKAQYESFSGGGVAQ